MVLLAEIKVSLPQLGDVRRSRGSVHFGSSSDVYNIGSSEKKLTAPQRAFQEMKNSFTFAGFSSIPYA